MKRFVQILFCLVAINAVAQEDFPNTYVISVTGYMDPNNDPNVDDCNSGYYLNVVYETGEQAALTPYRPVGGGSPSPFSGRIEFSSTRKVSGIFVHAKNENKKFDLKGWYCRGSEEETIFPISLTTEYPCSNRTIQFDLAKYQGQIVFDIQPLLSPKFSLRCNQTILPSDIANRITIVGPSPNLATFYHWVFSTDGVVWNNLSADFQGKNRIEISGYDLLGEEFINYHNRNIFFKIIVDCNGAESEILTLSGRVSAPNIVSVTPMPDRCYSVQRDGAFKITFDRPLIVDSFGNKEQLIVLVNDPSNANPPEQIYDVVLDETNSLTWPRRLQSDKQYIINILGKYLDAATYSDGPTTHRATLSLIRPTPVSSTIIASAVHCYGGGDGEISLSIRGGVGNYYFNYTKEGNGDIQQVMLGADASYVKSFLYADNYLIDVRDGNNCGDEAGIKTIRVSQPSEPLHIAYSLATDPLAFGYTDGHIETIIAGGTPNLDESYFVEWYDPNALLPNVLYDNAVLSDGYQANINNLGDGYYVVKAYDSQYGLANLDHRAGCMIVSDTFHLIQPPPLIVTLSEHHFINCHGFDNGEVAAHAQGGVKIQNGLPYKFEWIKEVDGLPEAIQQSDSIATQLRTGVYRVKITDKNNISKISLPFTLVEPELLTAQLNTTPVSCSSGVDGTVSALVQGGTLPYQYEWSVGESTESRLDQVIEGPYFVFITDSRACTTTASGKVGTPYPLQVDSIIYNPQCFGYDNGAIDLTVRQGTAPYRYEWSTGETTEDIQGLPKGVYRVMITDQNNCKAYRDYKLQEPEKITINLGGERLLCNGQEHIANAALADLNTKYIWTGPNGFSATTAEVALTEEGLYRVDVEDSDGCKGSDDLIIKRIQVDISSEFIVSTQAFSKEDVTLLNISNPSPDSVHWWSTSQSEITFKEKHPNKAILFFDTDGTYTIYLKSYRQGCEKSSSKTITVLSKSFDDNTELKSPFIENFSVSPNPSMGAFVVNISLQEVSSIRLRLISLTSNVTLDDRQEHGNSQYILPYNISLAAGTYMLLLESPKGSNLIKVVVY